MHKTKSFFKKVKARNYTCPYTSEFAYNIVCLLKLNLLQSVFTSWNQPCGYGSVIYLPFYLLQM